MPSQILLFFSHPHPRSWLILLHGPDVATLAKYDAHQDAWRSRLPPPCSRQKMSHLRSHGKMVPCC
ncbi:hypothetical protein SETIT_1G200600v2 [Setaria italica]|uniref:Uncharacterized protein n=2 Tax=Setaria TaxID=4554 RepID=A0A368PPG9_SETIT|nr:hypothetical protein SETIT_1G200600v2 [Setaria italica]TKW39804.1 hypothetical protein SEVIR_1G203700v2 [Setaria viridis]